MSFANFNPSSIINDFQSHAHFNSTLFAFGPDTGMGELSGESSMKNLSSQRSSKTPEKECSIHKLPIHETIVHRLDEFIAKNQIPHIIFHGPSGSGKQTIVRDFIQRIY